MRKSSVTNYTIHAETYDEHVRLLQRIFEQLTENQPDTVDYQVMCLPDGVSFCHVSTYETVDGSNPLPGLISYKDFLRDAGARITSLPVPANVTTIGAYRGLSTTTAQIRRSKG